jgi:hypothetical protein
VTLLEVAAALSGNASRTITETNDRGSSSGGQAIKVSLQRLRHRCDLIADTLAQTGKQTQTV